MQQFFSIDVAKDLIVIQVVALL